MSMRVTIRGLPELVAALGDTGAVAAALADGLRAGAAVVERAAKLKVHSPDNPYIGKAGHNVATGKLQASLGHSDVEGSGLGLSIRVGHPYGKAALAEGGTFARSKDSGRRTRSGRIIAIRTGGGKKGQENKEDVEIYGPIEERRHPFLAPAVTEHAGEITDAISGRIQSALGRLVSKAG